MVPAIFSQMEQASDSEDLDSCEEEELDKRTGNSFQDFALDLQDIPDEDLKFTVKLARKMIVDYIEAGKDMDMEGWKPVKLKNPKSNI